MVNGAWNYTGDAHIENWPEVVGAAEKLGERTVLPGHGAPGGPELLTGQAQFFRELLGAVRKEMERGKKLEDLVRMRDGQPESTIIELPAAVRNWTGKSLPAQVRDAYLELSKKQPRGAM